MRPCPSAWSVNTLPALSCPFSPPRWIHEYQLTPHSLYAAVSIGLECDTILAVLNRLSKNVLPADIRRFVRACTQNYGKVGYTQVYNNECDSFGLYNSMCAQ